MSPNRVTLPELEAMRDEHDDIFAALKLVRRGLAMLDPDTPTPEALAAQVRTWRTRLRMHVMQEERQGLHDRLVELLPESKHEIDALRAQHAEILRALEVVGDRLEAGKVVDFGVVRDRLDAIENLWCRHETSEDELLCAALDAAGPEPDAVEGAGDGGGEEP